MTAEQLIEDYKNEELKQQVVVLDATALSYLMSCPRLYNFRINESLVPSTGKSNSLEIGSLAHTIKEFYNKALIEGKSRTNAIAIGFSAGMEYVNGYKPTNKYITDPFDLPLKNTPENTTKEGKRELIGWKYVFDTMNQYFAYYCNDNFVPLGAEEVRRKIAYQDDELIVIWKAKFDEIIPGLHGPISSDTKTSKQREEVVRLNNQFIGQCFILDSLQMQIDHIGWQTSLKVEEKFRREYMNYSFDNINELMNDTVPYYARMLIAYTEASNFPPNHNSCRTKYGKCQFIDEFLGNVCLVDRDIRGTAIKNNFIVGKKWDI